MKPIYEPKGRAKEYGDLAINIYTGCNHGCTYCYAPLVVKRTRAEFHANVTPRKDIVGAVERQISKEKITGKLIHLCFTCDPYPAEIDTSPTREVIKVIKATGNNVQILTKGGECAMRDFDLLDGGDWFGVTITSLSVPKSFEREPKAKSVVMRLKSLQIAQEQGIKTWVSCESVFEPEDVYEMITAPKTVDLFKIGKLNYAKSNIDWGEFGRECERLCIEYGRNYYIKEDLRRAMDEQ